MRLRSAIGSSSRAEAATVTADVHGGCRNVAPAHPSHHVFQPPDFVLHLGPGPGEVLENQSVRSTHHIPDILTEVSGSSCTLLAMWVA